jgi:hypothetical protein
LGISGGVDDFVRTYGDRRCQDLLVAEVYRREQEPQFDDCPIDSEFLLATAFLWGWGLRICFSVAFVIMVRSILDDPGIWKDGSIGCHIAAAISYMADICGIFEWGSLGDEFLKRYKISFPFVRFYCIIEKIGNA